jgi:hypothetical protein
VRRIARAGGGVLRDRTLDRREVPRTKRHISGAERLGELIAAARADQRHDVGALPGHPGDRRLRNADALGVGDAPQGFDQREVGIDIAALEARARRAEIAAGAPFDNSA